MYGIVMLWQLPPSRQHRLPRLQAQHFLAINVKVLLFSVHLTLAEVGTRSPEGDIFSLLPLAPYQQANLLE
jgi:hypothetical protein